MDSDLPVIDQDLRKERLLLRNRAKRVRGSEGKARDREQKAASDKPITISKNRK